MAAKRDTYGTDETTAQLRVGDGFDLGSVDPDSTPGYRGGKKAGGLDLTVGADELDTLQERLYAESRAAATRSSVLLVLQAMDSAGKGGIVRHVVGSVDPQGIALAALKRRPRRSARTTFSGASRSGCRSPVSSASSTGRTTKTC